MTRRELFGVLAAPALAATSKPNIVFILADDLGWGDLSCYNPASKIPTPNLDKLAADGMRFTDAHTPSAVCSPTRYGLMTGRYCWRSRLKKGVLDGFDPPLIESGRTTAASFLKKQGYATACFGKWHLGMQWTQKDGQPVGIRTIGGFRPGFDVDYTKPTTGGPNDHGFDTYFGISASLDMPPYCLMENRRTVSIPDDQVPESRTLFLNQGAGVTTKGFRLEQVIPAITSKAVEFIERQTGPFFLYVPLSSPHLPVVPNPEFEGRSKAGKYGDFVVEMDAAVGKILAALDKTGANKNTLVCFSSDNGGLWHWWNFQEPDDVAQGKITPRGTHNKDFSHQSNAWMRGTKADIWEGGHRVPFLARWPGKIKPGAVSESVICLTDLLATCAAMLGQKLPPNAGEDSVSLLPVFADAKRTVREHLIHHSLNGLFAIRAGDWKLVPERGSGGFSVPKSIDPKAGGPKGQLFNLKLDRAETKNVYDQHPDVVDRLSKLLEKVIKTPG